MSPQIEWHVNEDNREETIVKTTSSSPHRWRLSMIALMIVLGVGLGTVYSSVKEPAPVPTLAPTITPPPTTTPSPDVISLTQTIDRESQALADGDLKTFLSIQYQYNGAWYPQQARDFQAWGQPSSDQSPLYYFVGQQPSTLTGDRIWLDTLQYRDGGYFRQLRFYRKIDDQWLRMPIDPAYWSGIKSSLQTALFMYVYPTEDQELLQMIELRFKNAFNEICGDFQCSFELTEFLPFNIEFQIGIDRPSWWLNKDQQVEVVFPSARTVGVYNSMDTLEVRKLNDPFTQQIYDTLIPTVSYIESGSTKRWSKNMQGWLYSQAINAWETYRLSEQPNMLQLLPPKQLSNNIPLIKLESLWTMQNVPSNPEQVANSVIFFIEQKYGVDGVAKFLKAIGPANSFKEAIQNSLGVDEIRFEQQWKDWLKQVYAQGS